MTASPELAYPVTTDTDRIARFLDRPGPQVVSATYQSSTQVAAAMAKIDALFDPAIADEAHRCGGKTSTEFGTILDGDKIQSLRLLFLTASTRVYAKWIRKKAGAAHVQIEADPAPVVSITVFSSSRLSFLVTVVVVALGRAGQPVEPQRRRFVAGCRKEW